MKAELLHDTSEMRTGEELEYRVYSSLAQISLLSSQWDDLLASAEGNRAFASLEWYAASCSKHQSWEPYTVAAFHNGKISCILPLVIDREDETAQFPHHGADYNDLIASPASPALAAALIQFALIESRCRRMVLSKLRPDAYCTRAFPLLRDDPNIACCWSDIDSYRFIQLPEGFDAYLSSRSKVFRKGIRRALRNFDGSGLIVRELCPRDFDPACLPAVLMHLAVARHQEKCSFTRQPYIQHFLSEVIPPLFLKQNLRAFAILKGEEIVGLDLCMVHSRGLVTWNGGFLPEVECWSPGSVLFAHEIERAIASGLQEFDFIRGEEAYKRSWANGSYTVGEIELLRK